LTGELQDTSGDLVTLETLLNRCRSGGGTFSFLQQAFYVSDDDDDDRALENRHRVDM